MAMNAVLSSLDDDFEAKMDVDAFHFDARLG